MLNHLLAISEYIIESFLHTWPYLLITIPIAVAVKMSGAARYINHAFTARPILAVVLATFVGAFSPLCSCSVIPVVAALLIGGVPLAPVMSFWLASPSMDPEIFFLTVSTLGWELAVWRLAATLVMSLGGGFITQLFSQNGWLGAKFVRETQSTQVQNLGKFLRQAWHYTLETLNSALVSNLATGVISAGGVVALPKNRNRIGENATKDCSKCSTAEDDCDENVMQPVSENTPQTGEASFWKRLIVEIWAATIMVVKFMLLAWFLGAIIRLYLPDTWIPEILGENNPWAIVTAALLGIPVYTSSLAALPLVGGLLAQGMHPAAALAFLVAGPTTTLPAMSAVWGLVNRRVFSLYIGLSLFGAILIGYFYDFILSV